MIAVSQFLAIAAVVVGTWNGKWFPSGRAEHRAAPAVEAATIAAAGGMIRSGLAKIDPEGTNDLILCFNEIRNADAANGLCAAIGRTNLTVAIISGYRRRDRFDQQQDVIMTTLPVRTANWSLWRRPNRVFPPRGYAHAVIEFPGGREVAVYAVHLKSNYGATTEAIRRENRLKRMYPVEQLIEQERKAPRVIIAGDFNADCWRKEFAEETIFSSFKKAGYENPLERLPASGRATYPSSRNGDSVLDYIMVRGLRIIADPVIQPSASVSDHNAVFVRCDLVGGFRQD